MTPSPDYAAWDDPIDPTRDHHRFLELAQVVAHHHARKYGIHPGETFDDLVGDAAEMLAKCAHSWDPTMAGKSGTAFLWARMTGAIITAHRNRYGRAMENGVPSARMAAKHVPLDWKPDDKDDWVSRELVLVDVRAGDEFDLVEDRMTLEALLNRLSSRHRHVIEEVSLKGRSCPDVAVDLGVTESRTYQMRQEALASMRDGKDRSGDATTEERVLQMLAPRGMKLHRIAAELGISESRVHDVLGWLRKAGRVERVPGVAGEWRIRGERTAEMESEEAA